MAGSYRNFPEQACNSGSLTRIDSGGEPLLSDSSSSLSVITVQRLQSLCFCWLRSW